MMPKEVKKYKLLEVCELVAGSRATKSETGIFPIKELLEMFTCMLSHFGQRLIVLSLNLKK